MDDTQLKFARSALLNIRSTNNYLLLGFGAVFVASVKANRASNQLAALVMSYAPKP